MQQSHELTDLEAFELAITLHGAPGNVGSLPGLALLLSLAFQQLQLGLCLVLHMHNSRVMQVATLLVEVCMGLQGMPRASQAWYCATDAV